MKSAEEWAGELYGRDIEQADLEPMVRAIQADILEHVAAYCDETAVMLGPSMGGIPDRMADDIREMKKAL